MEDIFDEQGALTAEYLAARGYCCGLECKNCPYLPQHGGIDAVLSAPYRQGGGLGGGVAADELTGAVTEEDQYDHGGEGNH